MLAYRSYRGLKYLLHLLGLGVVLVVLAQALRLTFGSDSQNTIRSLDRLIINQHYYQALSLLQQADLDYDAVVWSRRGLLHTLRAEHEQANLAFAYALRSGVSGLEYDLMRLYQGYNSVSRGYEDEARNAWEQIGWQSSLSGLRLVLEGELSLKQQDYSRAEGELRQALRYSLPQDWRRVVHLRLALLRASSDPQGALAELQQGSVPSNAVLSGHYVDLAEPLLPTSTHSISQVRSVIQAAPDQRAQMLGQIYLDSGWYTLAELQFQSIPSTSPLAFSAKSYLAYTQWQIGASEESRQQLHTLMEAYPNDPRPRALLALIYLSESQGDEAQVQLNLVQGMAPYQPDTFLAWAQWYSVQRDYAQAAQAYDNARTRATPDERLKYSIAQIRFLLTTSLQVCSTALSVAEEAVTLDSERADIWTLLAQVQLACNQTPQGLYSSQRALRIDSDNAESYFYQGQALFLLGERTAARESLINAANLAPDTIWRSRAEELLQQIEQ